MFDDCYLRLRLTCGRYCSSYDVQCLSNEDSILKLIVVPMEAMMTLAHPHTSPYLSGSVLHIALSDLSDSRLDTVATLSRREGAQAKRQDIEDHLSAGGIVELDCSATDATQSFMDELVGILVLERGPVVLQSLRFRGCSRDMKAIINFVVSDRAIQYQRNPHHFAPR